MNKKKDPSNGGKAKPQDGLNARASIRGIISQERIIDNE